ncbi:hypothetical protein GGX14DRAFT_620767 [Mycena pura]|uniref:Uncharacterized protein n=1 Tax=Mycena pura TaxID=153505 RepID=A0AAD6VP44_9AGAR|nr:hypothetical protein GGX14DRAFT_620767 [Mycena pura]
MDLFSKVLALNAIGTFTPRVTAFIIVHHANNNNNIGLSTTGRIVVIFVWIFKLIVALCIVRLVMRQRRAQSATVVLPPVTQGPPHPVGGYSEAYGPPPPGPVLYLPAQAPPMQGYYAPSPYALPLLPQRIGSEEEKGPQNNVIYSNYAPVPGPSAATPGSYPFALTPTPGSPPPNRGCAPPTGPPPPYTR